MALMLWDGFTHYGATIATPQKFGDTWWWTGNATLVGSPARFAGAQSLQLANDLISATLNTTNTRSQRYVGFAIYLPSTAPGGLTVTFRDGSGNTLCSFQFNADGSILAQDHAGATIGSAPARSFLPDQWFWIDLGVLMATAGELIVRVLGNTVIDAPGNTQGSGAAYWTTAQFTTSSSGAGYMTDLVVNDDTTGPGTFGCNSFMGDCRVITAFPTGNDTVAWTPLSGANWQNVSETAFDGDTSYNSAASAALADLFTLPASVPASSAVYGVQVTGGYRKDDAGTRTVQNQIKSGGMIYGGATLSIAEAYLYYADRWILDPHTGSSWTVANANAVEAGYLTVS